MKTVAVEGLVLEAVNVDRDDIHTKMALIEQVISVVHPVCSLIMLVFKEECLLILYRKYFQRLGCNPYSNL